MAFNNTSVLPDDLSANMNANPLAFLSGPDEYTDSTAMQPQGLLFTGRYDGSALQPQQGANASAAHGGDNSPPHGRSVPIPTIKTTFDGDVRYPDSHGRTDLGRWRETCSTTDSPFSQPWEMHQDGSLSPGPMHNYYLSGPESPASSSDGASLYDSTPDRQHLSHTSGPFLALPTVQQRGRTLSNASLPASVSSSPSSPSYTLGLPGTGAASAPHSPHMSHQESSMQRLNLTSHPLHGHRRGASDPSANSSFPSSSCPSDHYHLYPESPVSSRSGSFSRSSSVSRGRTSAQGSPYPAFGTPSDMDDCDSPRLNRAGDDYPEDVPPPPTEVVKALVTSTAIKAASMSRRTNEAKYLCEVPGCEQTFTRRSNLTGHYTAHSGKKPFACQECEKCFARQSDCKRHEKTHQKKRQREQEAAALSMRSTWVHDNM